MRAVRGNGVLFLAIFMLWAAAVPVAAAKPRLAAAVHRTEHGVVHVVADDDRGIGYGYGHAVAQDHICLLAESYVTVAGDRSRFFGPDGEFVFHANNAHQTNLESDLFYRQLNRSGVLARVLRAKPPLGPSRGVRAQVRGYVAGYNRYLRDVGRDHLPDRTCRGKPWVRPITEADAYERFMQIASLAGGGIAIAGVAQAQPPPGGEGGSGAAAAPQADQIADLGRRLELTGMGSNAIALGRRATRSGAGMLLGNPHLPWDGDGRLYHAHLTIPGKMDVSGATFIGVPFVVIGHTRGLAWSHTTSSAFRFTPFEVRLEPGSPTTYLVDGAPKQMTSRTIAVPVRRDDGSRGTVSRTLWSTEYGPVLTSLLGTPIFPWTAERAYAFADANAENLRYLNHFHAVDRAQSVDALARALRRHQGIPWANTIATDSTGRAFYADASVVPHVTDAHATTCNTELGRGTYQQLRLPVLDGSRSSCGWASDTDSVHPGIFGPKSLPFLSRADYVENSNDSHWLTNPKAPLEGFARIIGDERTERSLRTRLGLRMIREGRPFTLAQLQRMMFNDRNGGAELMRDDLVAICRQLPILPSSRGPIATGDACDVLEHWDARDRLDSRGALLFRRFAQRALAQSVPGPNAVGGGAPPAGTWLDAFDPSRPVDTPNTLNTASPVIRQALGDAIADLDEAGIALDAPVRDFQAEQRGAERIPIHGGPGPVGVFNAIAAPWVPGKGYPDVIHGTSFLIAAEMRGRCPPVRTLVSYSQSSDPTSPWFADQTRMYSRGKWVTERYCEGDVLRSPVLATRRVGCLPARAGGGAKRLAWLAPGTSAGAARRRTGRPDARRGRRAWRWCVAGGGRVHAVFRGAPRRAAFVATTAPAHRLAGARPGARLDPAGWRSLGDGLYARRAGRRHTFVAAVRNGRVAWVALLNRGGQTSRRAVALARLAGLS